VVIGLLIIAALLLFDMQNVFAGRRVVVQPTGATTDDYTIVVPLYGHRRYFRNRAELEPYRARVLLAVGTAKPAMQRFADDAEREGWRVHRCPEPCSISELTAGGLEVVETNWAIRLDGDASFVEDPGCAVAAAAASGADFFSVKIIPSRSQRLLEKLQEVEYGTAMLGRHHRPWLTSGACMLGRTAAFRRTLAHHSGWFLGEDIETGLIARRLGLRIAHLNVAVRTDVPGTLPALWRQRRGWWAGCFRQTWINLDHCCDDPLSLVYRVALVWLLLYGKVQALTRATHLLPVVILLYTCVLLASNWSVRSRWMILFPYYALAQALVLPVFGAVEYGRVAYASRSFGRYRVQRRRVRA
jgi:Glycosyl transferase family group 2